MFGLWNYGQAEGPCTVLLPQGCYVAADKRSHDDETKCQDDNDGNRSDCELYQNMTGDQAGMASFAET